MHFVADVRVRQREIGTEALKIERVEVRRDRNDLCRTARTDRIHKRFHAGYGLATRGSSTLQPELPVRRIATVCNVSWHKAHRRLVEGAENHVRIVFEERRPG